MSQQQVLDFLADHPQEWFTTYEICQAAGITKNSCIQNLVKLRKANFLLYKRLAGTVTKRFLYKHKE